ncbi:MAG: M23 family metallopeptidase [Deltaproteobacteria bacterium]|nr:M23 family metallopeptidase [Deltaproteobacteria bacterium]MBP7291743.1 M23 family metallopeptidase [Nannocystaceae bacterium]
MRRVALCFLTACGDPSASTGEGSSSTGDVSTTGGSSESSSSGFGSGSGSETRGDSSTTAVDPCAACPQHSQCSDDACVCDDGYFANNDACVDRILFALPMANPDAEFIGEVVGFDNDPLPGDGPLDCLSHDGQPFPACYDDHTGTDFILLGGFTTMDNGSADVLAAAEGVVVFTHDGEYDRCALNLAAQMVQCEDGGPVTPPNEITVLHDDGMSTRYLHLKKNSILVAEGDRVSCGQVMALVGSSGNSSAPHLHFEVVDVEGASIDPYAGPSSHPETYWVEQDGANDLPGASCQ